MWTKTPLRSFLRRQKKSIALQLGCLALFALVFFLYRMPMDALLYALSLCAVLLALALCISFVRYLRKSRALAALRSCVETSAFSLPEPDDALEADYQALLQKICAHRTRLAAENENRYHDLTDYFTLWVHQIKTPIAAMQLLLQAEHGQRSRELSAELFKIEQYVGMVLTYLHLGNDDTDYLFRRCPLDEIVRACARKYAKLFILKKISLSFQPTGMTVLTDEKWLSFVIEQLLSNALKYTHPGGCIRILKDGSCLVIADNGIGIRSEDLPRVFEKGFTGCNGRSDKKSTGIGLYLCKKITGRLGHDLTISSVPGTGTRVYLHLSSGPAVVE